MDEMDELVDAAEALHAQTAKVAAGARRWRRLRRSGVPLAEIVRSDQNRALLHHTTGAARAATSLLNRVRLVVIHQLADQGWSRRQLAGLIGVTHQRVSKIVHPEPRRAALGGET